MATFNLENLTKLCRVCGQNLGQNTYNVSNLSKRLHEHFFLTTTNDENDIHPKKKCQKCYSKLSNIENRSTTWTMKIAEWHPHMDDYCITCSSVVAIKKGGRPKKQKKQGRPKQGLFIWNREQINKFISNVPDDVIEGLDDDILLNNNSHLEICKCDTCLNIIRRPIIITKCEHMFCLRCIMPLIEGKPETDLKCPVCKLLYLKCDIVPSKYINNVLLSSTIKCFKLCGKAFNIEIRR